MNSTMNGRYASKGLCLPHFVQFHAPMMKLGMAPDEVDAQPQFRWQDEHLQQHQVGDRRYKTNIKEFYSSDISFSQSETLEIFSNNVSHVAQIRESNLRRNIKCSNCEVSSVHTMLAVIPDWNIAAADPSDRTIACCDIFVIGTAAWVCQTRSKQDETTRPFFAKASFLGYTRMSRKNERFPNTGIKVVDSGMITVCNLARRSETMASTLTS